MKENNCLLLNDTAFIDRSEHKALLSYMQRLGGGHHGEANVGGLGEGR